MDIGALALFAVETDAGRDKVGRNDRQHRIDRIEQEMLAAKCLETAPDHPADQNCTDQRPAHRAKLGARKGHSQA